MAFITTNREIKIFPKASDLFHSAAEDFTERAIQAINDTGVFTVVLAGGNTPKKFFETLTENKYCLEKTPWRHIKFFFGDERYLPSTDPENNYHKANENLFSKLSVPRENIYRIPTEFSNPQDTAKNYELTLKKVFCIKDHDFPNFDLVYLGLGKDAHTASLMPFSDLVVPNSTDQLVACLWVSQSQMYRITLTPAAINNAKSIIFLVTGTNKAGAVYSVLKGPHEPQKFPAQLIHSINGKTIWFLDQEAAKKL